MLNFSRSYNTFFPLLSSSEPCAPMNLSVHYNVTTAQVTWAAARGASSYSALAVADRGPPVRCNATGNGCFLSGLLCSRVYNVSVTAHDQTCDGESSLARRVTTGERRDGQKPAVKTQTSDRGSTVDSDF